MALKWADRVQETFTTTGTGAVSLGGAATGYQTFASSMSNADTCYYAASDGTNWEAGIGTYATSGNTLTRTQILSSSNGGSAVNWVAGTKNIWLDFPAAAVQNALSTYFGQCQLQFASSTQVTLFPFQGNRVTFPSGAAYNVPSAGLASGSVAGGCSIDGAGSSTLSAGSLYYVYLWYNAGTPILDFSLTGHATDSSTGVEIKTGDNTRVLVGMVYPNAGPVLLDNTTGRLVASWFNRRSKYANGGFGSNHTITQTSVTEINSEIQAPFLSWGDAANFSLNGTFTGGTSNASMEIAIGLDGVSTLLAFESQNVWNNGLAMSFGMASPYNPTEGKHYATVGGAASSGTLTNNAANLFATVVI